MVWLADPGVREVLRKRTVGVWEGLLGEIGEGVNFGGDEQQPSGFTPYPAALAEDGN